MRRRRPPLIGGVTLVELLVSASMFSLVMLAIISFYVEAMAVSSKRDQQSERLRRFHLGLTRIEDVLREGRVVRCGTRVLTVLKQSDAMEADGFPLYDRDPLQFVSSKEGVMLIQGERKQLVLPVKDDETVLFGWVQHDPPKPARNHIVRITLYRMVTAKSSELVFSRVLPPLEY